MARGRGGAGRSCGPPPLRVGLAVECSAYARPSPSRLQQAIRVRAPSRPGRAVLARVGIRVAHRKAASAAVANLGTACVDSDGRHGPVQVPDAQDTARGRSMLARSWEWRLGEWSPAVRVTSGYRSSEHGARPTRNLGPHRDPAVRIWPPESSDSEPSAPRPADVILDDSG
jgi:hypothetical protein